jgi:alkanesulfonate monooxygenase SsuD/methylene tetrahydromethanopterin reductase-like flavin-dependent oxidoreductase (luciferase family)
MKFWQSVSWAEAGQLVEIAKFAEEVGFHGVINSEHLFLTRKTDSPYPYTEDGKMNHALDYDYPDVWSSFAAMAAVTTRLHFSSSVYLLPLRNPIEVAKQAGTCALISNNRVTIGFGVGWQKEEFDAMGVDFHTRGKRTDEMIEVMRKLWQGGVVSHLRRQEPGGAAPCRYPVRGLCRARTFAQRGPRPDRRSRSPARRGGALRRALRDHRPDRADRSFARRRRLQAARMMERAAETIIGKMG